MSSAPGSVLPFGGRSAGHRSARVVAGIHSPGFRPGLQSFKDNLTYASGASIVWELGSNTTAVRGSGRKANDVTGTATGLEKLSIAGSPWPDAFGCSFSTTHADLEVQPHEYAGNVDLTTVETASIPEPGSLLALAGLLGGGLSLRRRKA